MDFQETWYEHHTTNILSNFALSLIPTLQPFKMRWRRY